MKRWLSVLLIVMICSSCVACKGKPKTVETAETPSASQTVEPSPEATDGTKPAEPAQEAEAENKEKEDATVVSATEAPVEETATIEEKKPEANKGAEVPAEPLQTLAPSTNKEVVNKDTAPDVYWAMDTAYHLKDCSELKDKQASKITWDMVEQIMLRQCPVCNPPQYKGYVENED